MSCPRCAHHDQGVNLAPRWRRALGLRAARFTCTAEDDTYVSGGGWGNPLCGCTHRFHDLLLQHGLG